MISLLLITLTATKSESACTCTTDSCHISEGVIPLLKADACHGALADFVNGAARFKLALALALLQSLNMTSTAMHFDSESIPFSSCVSWTILFNNPNASSSPSTPPGERTCGTGWPPVPGALPCSEYARLSHDAGMALPWSMTLYCIISLI